MNKHVIIITHKTRAKAMEGVRCAPVGYVMELREPKRSDDQNAALWGLLNQIQRQRPMHNGVKMTPELWKIVFVQALGMEMRLLPTLENDGFFPTGYSSSNLTKQEFTNLLELIMAWAAREGLTVDHFDGVP